MVYIGLYLSYAAVSRFDFFAIIAAEGGEAVVSLNFFWEPRLIAFTIVICYPLEVAEVGFIYFIEFLSVFEFGELSFKSSLMDCMLCAYKIMFGVGEFIFTCLLAIVPLTYVFKTLCSFSKGSFSFEKLNLAVSLEEDLFAEHSGDSDHKSLYFCWMLGLETSSFYY